ncbi:MAG: hypothetical protein WBE01_03695, partial [Methyloceanibacter sp.]
MQYGRVGGRAQALKRTAQARLVQIDLQALVRIRAQCTQGTQKLKQRLGYGQQALPRLAHGPCFD